METVNIGELRFKSFIQENEISETIQRMAREINTYYKGKHVHLVVVLKGAFIFAADLIRYLEVDHTLHFVKFSSYDGTKSSGTINEEFALKLDPNQNDILIIEDIVDTGSTLQYFLTKLEKEAPNSVHIATLLVKPAAMKFDLYIRFRGFDIENKFVIGYGLDFDDHGRNLRHIYQLAD